MESSAGRKYPEYIYFAENLCLVKLANKKTIQ